MKSGSLVHLIRSFIHSFIMESRPIFKARHNPNIHVKTRQEIEDEIDAERKVEFAKHVEHNENLTLYGSLQTTESATAAAIEASYLIWDPKEKQYEITYQIRYGEFMNEERKRAEHFIECLKEIKEKKKPTTMDLD